MGGPEQTLTPEQALADPGTDTPQGEDIKEQTPSEIDPLDGVDFDAPAEQKPESAAGPLPEDGAQQEQPDKKPLSEAEKAQKAIDKQHYKYQEEHRQHLATQQKLEEARRQLEEAQKTTRPEVPDYPDQYDPDFETKMKARDDAILAANTWDANQQQLQQQQQEVQQQQAREQMQEVQRKNTDFYTRVINEGYDADKFADSDAIVGQTLTHPVVGDYLLTSKNGPALVDHLAKHTIELSKVANMTVDQAILYMEQTIAPTLQKPNVQPIPDPLNTPSGRGVTEVKDPALEGVVFE